MEHICLGRYDLYNNPKVFLIRSGEVHGNKTDDIPFAQRAGSYRRPSRKQIKLFAFLAIIFSSCFSVIFISSNYFFSSNIVPPLKGYQDLPSPDGRLLGHFPYPEASFSDLVEAYPGMKVHTDTFEALRLMRNAASAEGINLVLLSGYRSHALQKEIFFEIKSTRNQTAVERSKVSAPPGYSEHSTGYAIDLGDGSRRDTDFEVDFETTRAFQWLKKNAAKYHFILSFPRGNSQGVSYEPWHWRFEGTAEALREFKDAQQFSVDR